jgi:hypothetical protein
MINLDKFIYTNCAEIHNTLPDNVDITLIANILRQMRFTCKFTIDPIEMIWLKLYVGFDIISERTKTDFNDTHTEIVVMLPNTFMTYVASSVSNIIEDNDIITEQVILDGLNERLDIINANITATFMKYMSLPANIHVHDTREAERYGRYNVTLKGLQYVADLKEHTAAYINLGIKNAAGRKASMLTAIEKLFSTGETHMQVAPVEIVAGLPWRDYLSNMPDGISLLRPYFTVADFKRLRNEGDYPLTDREYLDDYNRRLSSDPQEKIYSNMLCTTPTTFNLNQKQPTEYSIRDISDTIRPVVISATKDLHKLYLDNNK